MNFVQCRFRIFLFCIVFLSFFGVGNVLFAETKVVILHSNDHHGHLSTMDGKGGLTRLETIINNERAKNIYSRHSDFGYVFLFDAGDVNMGTPESDIFMGRPDILAFNQLRYDYVTFGNHEFDIPFSRLESQLEIAEFPFGSANVRAPDGTPLGAEYRVFDLPDGVVGVFGITTKNLNIIAMNPSKFQILDEIETARNMVRFLRKEKHADFIVAVTHLGILKEMGTEFTSLELADAVPGIDLIIDGHSHTKMEVPLRSSKTQTPIVSANEWNKFLGKAVVTLQDGRVTDFTWSCIPVTDAIPESESMKVLLKPFLDEAQKRLGRVAAETTAVFDGENRIQRRQETALGNLLADSMIWKARQDGFPCDFAFVNGGNIRASLPAGKITLFDIATVLPFQNEVWVLELDGVTLREFFRFAATIPQGSGGFPQMSHEIHYVLHSRTHEITDLTINGVPIDDARTYYVASTDFIARGGDGYEILKKRKSARNLSLSLPTIFAQYLETFTTPLEPRIEGRIEIQDEPQKTLP